MRFFSPKGERIQFYEGGFEDGEWVVLDNGYLIRVVPASYVTGSGQLMAVDWLRFSDHPPRRVEDVWVRSGIL